LGAKEGRKEGKEDGKFAYLGAVVIPFEDDSPARATNCREGKQSSREKRGGEGRGEPGRGYERRALGVCLNCLIYPTRGAR